MNKLIARVLIVSLLSFISCKPNSESNSLQVAESADYSESSIFLDKVGNAKLKALKSNKYWNKYFNKNKVVPNHISFGRNVERKGTNNVFFGSTHVGIVGLGKEMKMGPNDQVKEVTKNIPKRLSKRSDMALKLIEKAIPITNLFVVEHEELVDVFYISNKLFTCNPKKLTEEDLESIKKIVPRRISKKDENYKGLAKKNRSKIVFSELIPGKRLYFYKDVKVGEIDDKDERKSIQQFSPLIKLLESTGL